MHPPRSFGGFCFLRISSQPACLINPPTKRMKGEAGMNRSQFQAVLSLFLIFALMAALPVGALAEADPAASASSNSTTSTPVADPQLRSEVEQLKQLVREQQKRIEALESERGVAGSPTVGVSAPRHSYLRSAHSRHRTLPHLRRVHALGRASAFANARDQPELSECGQLR